MAGFIAHLLITAAMLLVVANVIDGLEIKGWTAAILGALILGLANALVRPLMVFLTFPLTILTFGLFLLIVNGIILQLTAFLTPGIKIDGCGSAILGAVILAALNIAIEFLVGAAWPR